MPLRDGSSQCSRTQRRSTECEVTHPSESAAEKESTSLERGQPTPKMVGRRDQLRASHLVAWFKKDDLFRTAVGVVRARSLYLPPQMLCELCWSPVHPPSSHVAMPSGSVLRHPEELQVSSKTGRFNDTLAVGEHIGQELSDALTREKLNLKVLGPPGLYQLRHAGRLAGQMTRLPPSAAKLAEAAWRSSNATLVPPSRCSRA